MTLPELIPSDLPVFVRKSSRADFMNSVVPDGTALLFAQSDSHSGVRFITKNSDGTYTEVGGGGGADITLGVVDSNGKFQPLKFDGTDASESGEPETVVNYKSWNSTYPPPVPVPPMNFYKCASVDTSNSEWSGYRATLNDGIYSFASTVTSGLSFTTITPVVNAIYTEDALCKVSQLYTGIPLDYIFYAPFSTAEQELITGQTVSYNGTLNFSSTPIPNVEVDSYSGNGNYIQFSSFTIGSQATFSFWMKTTADSSQTGAMQLLNTTTTTGATFGFNSYYLNVDSQRTIDVNDPNASVRSASFPINTWIHIAIVCNSSGSTSIYLNGELSKTGNNSAIASIISSSSEYRLFYNAGNTSHGWTGFKGCLSSLRIYNRILSQAEISALANEFHPTAS